MKTMTAKDLKNALLQEAVQGRLVPQCAADGNARTLLDAIRAEKQKSAKSKSSKPLPPISDDEIPFEIPDSWVWVRLGEVCDYLHRGKSPKYGDDKILPIMAQKCNQWDKIYTEKCLFADKQTIERYSEEQYLQIGDTIINSTGGGTVGRTGYIDEYVFSVYPKFVADSHITVVRGNKQIEGKYLYYYLISPFIQIGLEERCSGSTNQIELGTETIRNYMFPLPPLAEQHRIVSAIEKLLPLIDEYGKKELVINALNNTIGQTAKKAILQEAVQGRLVPQCAADGNARELLDAIRAEKQKSAKSKSSKPLPPISDDEIPFDIPDNWVWVRLGDYLDIRDGTHDSPKFHSEGIPFVTSKNLRNGEIDFSTAKLISVEDHNKFSERSNVEDGDILFAMIGSIGNPVIVKKDREFSIKNVALFKRHSDKLTDMKYIFYYLEFIQTELKKIASGGVQQFVGLNMFREWLFPLPPLAEQHRIVSAIEKLLPMCERLGKE